MSKNLLTEDSILRLSRNQKLSIAHRGFSEIEATWKTAPSYEEVQDGSTTVYRYVAPGQVGVDNGEEVIRGQGRPLNLRAKMDDGIVITHPGTFKGTKIEPSVGDGVPASADTSYLHYTTYVYEGNASSSSANDGLIGPLEVALTANAIQPIINDTPGKTGGGAMDGDNYLTVPGYQVKTSNTLLGAIEFIGKIADGSVAKTSLTLSHLLSVGLPENMLIKDNLSAYQTAFANQGDAATVNTISKIAQVVYSVNKA